MKKREAVWELIMITFATVVVTTVVFFFPIPSHVSMGSISGLAIMLGNFIPPKISAITFVLNIFLLILGLLFIGEEFGSKTVYTSFLLPVVLAMFELMLPNNQSIANDAFLDILYCILVMSIGLAMLFSRNASSGGLDIVAKFLSKYLHMELGRAVSLIGMYVALSSALVYDKKIVVLSVLGTYLNRIALDHFVFGFNIKKCVRIISEHEGEIRELILHHLHGSATTCEAIGAYDKKPRREIIIIVDKGKYFVLMAFVLETNKDAFVTVYTVDEIIYRPKY